MDLRSHLPPSTGSVKRNFWGVLPGKRENKRRKKVNGRKIQKSQQIWYENLGYICGWKIKCQIWRKSIDSNHYFTHSAFSFLPTAHCGTEQPCQSHHHQLCSLPFLNPFFYDIFFMKFSYNFYPCLFLS